MWQCGQCGESVEDDFAVCWKCGTSREGLIDSRFQAVPDAGTAGPAEIPGRTSPIACSRCETTLQYVGRKRFHEGTNWGVFGELGELFVKREHFDFYVCPRCGRVEFFVDGIGEEFRPQ